MAYNNLKIRKTKRKKDIYIGNFLLKDIIIYSTIILFTFLFILVGFVYVKFISKLPPITELEKIQIKESSVIYDKNGKQLYMFGDEKRTYVDYNQISKNILNGIVSGEDKTFYENNGFDLSGLIRAVLYRITGKTDKIQGTSTISQQLIKIVLLTNERSFERKIKEAYLSYKMNKTYSKEKILELYLNKISYGSNAFGVEQAAITFFGKKAKDVNILEGSILSSLPKGPTFYSPYSHYDNLMGYLYFYPKNDEGNITKLIKKDDLTEFKSGKDLFTSFITKLNGTRVGENGINLCGLDNNLLKKKLNLDSKGCTIMGYSDLLNFLNSIQINVGLTNLEYQTGRKDFILGRLLEDNKITFNEYKEAIINAIGFEFKQYVENIKYPHFVLYVKEYLTEKYGEELLGNGGLKIFTTLDSTLQDKAEEIVKNRVALNKKGFNANNGALISIDNKNGDILAMVGGANYFDKTIDGNVNMITSKRQPGSTFKPFVYALAIDKNPIGPYTPIYDLKTVFPGNYEPKNFDGKFMGKINIITALNYSRNIPAIKAYYLAGGQAEIIKYLNTAGVNSLSLKGNYGAPLAIGAGEMTPLELVQAYSVFPNMGNKVEINPILKILDTRGLVIEEKRNPIKTRVLDEKTAYIMDYILSSSESRPNQYWNNFLTLNGRKAGAKTGTSNKLFIKNGKKEYFPGDLWTAGFTPQITTVVWAGNTNGKEIDNTGDGLNGAGSIWKEFMEFANKDLEALEFIKPTSLKYAKISKISGLLAPEGFDEKFTITSMFKNIPQTYDNSLKPIQVDTLCNGKVGALTPSSAIKNGYYLALHDIDPNNANWEASVQEWIKSPDAMNQFSSYNNIITNYKDTECIRDENAILSSNIQVKTNLVEAETLVVGNNEIEVEYTSTNPLKKIQILIGDQIISEISDVEGKKSGVYKGIINIPEGTKAENLLTVRLLDNIYYSGEDVRKVYISSKEKTPPKVIITNPANGKISLYEGTFFNLRGQIDDRSIIKSINIYLDGENYKIGLTGKEFIYEINKDGTIPPGIHTIKVEAVDNFFNRGFTEISLEVLPK